MDFHSLPRGPVLVQATLLAIGTTAATGAKADPPNDQSPEAPSLRRLPHPQFTIEDDGVRVVLAENLEMSRVTAAAQTIAALRLWLTTTPVLLPTGELEASVARQIAPDLPITIVDEDRFVIERDWWDKTVAALSRREQLGLYWVAEGFVGDVRIVEAPRGMEDTLGKKVLTFAGQDVASLEEVQRIHADKGGVVGAPVVLENGVTLDLAIAPPERHDIIRVAPTCGPCCHGADCYKDQIYNPGFVIEPPQELKKRKQKRKKQADVP